MRLLKQYDYEIRVLGHGLLGVVCAYIPLLVIPWALYVLLYEGVFKTLHTQNRTGRAHQWAAYIGGMEMILRMSSVGLPYEMAKYSVIILMLCGIIFMRRFSSRSGLLFFYFILQLPSIILLVQSGTLEEARQLAVFNLTGPLCLTLTGIYFLRRKITEQDFTIICKGILLPIAATVGWLFIRTPRLSELEFGFGASSAASGFGPNQMASILGLGVLLIGMAFLFRIKIFQNPLFGLGFILVLSYRALLTFSRGGMAAPVLILAGLFLYFLFTERRFQRKLGQQIVIGVILVLAGYGVFQYINQATNNALYNRYAGISYGKQVGVEKYTSGRLDILRIDLEIFMDNPFLGIGPGLGRDVRIEYGYYEKVAAHIEFSRLLAEHGILGIVALLILLGLPISEFYKRKTLEGRMILLVGVLFCLFFMLHSATRIALPMYLYGLGLAVPVFRIKFDD